MNSLHLLASTVDKALSISKDPSTLQHQQNIDNNTNNNIDNAIIDQEQDQLLEQELDDQIVTRASEQDIINSHIPDQEKDQDQEYDYHYNDNDDDPLNHFLWKLIYIIFFIPNYTFWKPFLFIMNLVFYPFFWLANFFGSGSGPGSPSIQTSIDTNYIDKDQDNETAIMEDTDEEEEEGFGGIGSINTVVTSDNANRKNKDHRSISTISEGFDNDFEEIEEDDLEFEIPSQSSTLADKLKSPTSSHLANSIIEEEEAVVDTKGNNIKDTELLAALSQQQQQEQEQPKQQQRQKKKQPMAKKKKQRFVFPRLLINNNFNLAQPPTTIPRKTLILDLDETLIHSLSRHNSSVFSKFKGKMIEIKVNNNLATLYYIYKRPFVDEFLNIVKNWFDLICFTASIKEYADPVINFLEEDFINNKGTKAFGGNNTENRVLFQKRYYRNDCIWEKGVGYIKDLSIITGEQQPTTSATTSAVENTPTKASMARRGRQRRGGTVLGGRNDDDGSESDTSSSRSNSHTRGVQQQAEQQAAAALQQQYVDPSKLIIIDNSPISYSLNKNNGIMIEGWINDPNDLELMNLLPLLNSLRFTSDVRAVLSLKDGEVAFND